MSGTDVTVPTVAGGTMKYIVSSIDILSYILPGTKVSDMTILLYGTVLDDGTGLNYYPNNGKYVIAIEVDPNGYVIAKGVSPVINEPSLIDPGQSTFTGTIDDSNTTSTLTVTFKDSNGNTLTADNSSIVWIELYGAWDSTGPDEQYQVGNISDIELYTNMDSNNWINIDGSELILYGGMTTLNAAENGVVYITVTPSAAQSAGGDSFTVKVYTDENYSQGQLIGTISLTKQ